MKRLSRVALLGLAPGAVLIFHFAGSAAGASATAPVFTKDIAPILMKNCVNCHRSGQIAPMSLISYKEVRPWAKSIREVVSERKMPPWYADPNHGEFANDRRLSQKDVETITAWIDGGVREGDPKDMPAVPKFPEGWTIGQPDLVLSMAEEFSVPSDGVVAYKYFSVPTNFTEDKYVQFAEIKQGNRALVHHVIVTVREPEAGKPPVAGEIRDASAVRRQDPEDPQNAQRGNRQQDGMLVGWAPGMSPLTLRPGQAKLVKAGSVLIFQMHYTTNGETGKDRTSVGLVFSKAPVEKRVITMPVAARNLQIPAGDPNYESRSSFTFKEDVHLVSFMPHMHVRGKDFEYKLVYPDGKEKILLKVPRYDFNWQLTYFVKEPIAVPKGSRLDCLAHHDNSAKNLYNPDPTKEVRWGPQTWEEMMIGWVDYTLDGQNLRLQTASAH